MTIAQSIEGATKAVKKAVNKVLNSTVNRWDMSTKEARERQVKRDLEFAKTEKGTITQKFVTLDDYYNNRHYTRQQAEALANKMGWTFVPPVLPDPFIQVESQIDPAVPQFQFKGRDNNLDPGKAKERQKAVQFVCYNNKLPVLTLENERPLNKLGNAFFKVAFDGSIQGPGFIGDIVIGNPDPANIFPDPAAYDVDDCEYLIYVFRMHRRKARRIYGQIIDSIGNDANHYDTEIYGNDDNTKRSINDDTLQVVEYWYRDEEGDIACTIQIDNTEVKHIPKYWINTRASGNKMYPFVKYCKIPVQKSFWDKGEIEVIKDLVDAADREFITAIMNDAFCANDITVYEKDAFVDGFEPSTVPGEKWPMKLGRINAAKRLGGISENSGILQMIQFIHEKIQETNGNFATKGSEPQRITTATGFAQLREDREARSTIKKADRLEGFNRLYELIDWTILDFYTQDRVIMINGQTEDEQPEPFKFNSHNHLIEDIAINPDTGEEINNSYFPRIDSEIISGYGIQKSVAFTLAATQELANMKITPENVGIILSIVDLLDLPNKQEIKESIEQGVVMQVQQNQPPISAEPPVEPPIIPENPELAMMGGEVI